MVPNLPATFASHLQALGVTDSVEKLAASGLPGLAIVVLTGFLIWMLKKLLDAKDEQKKDAIANGTALLNVSRETNTTANKVDQTLALNNEALKRVELQLEENNELMREANEIMRTIKDQRNPRR
jgi:hypothetical protein